MDADERQVTARRENGDGLEVYRLELPARARRQGGAQPAPLPDAARAAPLQEGRGRGAARRRPRRRASARSGSSCRWSRSRRRRSSARARRPPPRSWTCSRSWGWHDRPRPRPHRARPRRAGGDRLPGPHAGPRGGGRSGIGDGRGRAHRPGRRAPRRRCRARGATTVRLVRHADLDDYAPEAWGDALAAVARAAGAAAVVAVGTDRGNEVLAHVAAIEDLPFAANVTDIDVIEGDMARSPASAGAAACWSRRRVDAPVLILSGAAHAFPAAEPAAGETPPPAIEELDAGARPRSRAHPHRRAGDRGRRRYQPDRRRGRGQRRAGRGLGRRLRHRSRSWPACSAGPSAAPASSPTMAGGPTPTRSVRPASASPRSCTSPAASPAPSSTGSG